MDKRKEKRRGILNFDHPRILIVSKGSTGEENQSTWGRLKNLRVKTARMQEAEYGKKPAASTPEHEKHTHDVSQQQQAFTE